MLNAQDAFQPAFYVFDSHGRNSIEEIDLWNDVVRLTTLLHGSVETTEDADQPRTELRLALVANFLHLVEERRLQVVGRQLLQTGFSVT